MCNQTRFLFLRQFFGLELSLFRTIFISVHDYLNSSNFVKSENLCHKNFHVSLLIILLFFSAKN